MEIRTLNNWLDSIKETDPDMFKQSRTFINWYKDAVENKGLRLGMVMKKNKYKGYIFNEKEWMLLIKKFKERRQIKIKGLITDPEEVKKILKSKK